MRVGMEESEKTALTLYTPRNLAFRMGSRTPGNLRLDDQLWSLSQRVQESNAPLLPFVERKKEGSRRSIGRKIPRNLPSEECRDTAETRGWEGREGLHQVSRSKTGRQKR